METVREMMAAAVDEPDARPGMVGVIQTFASSLEWNPHIHSITSRGVWTKNRKNHAGRVREGESKVRLRGAVRRDW